MVRGLAIAPVDAARPGEFFAYLNDHLLDNGSPDTGYFQPLSRAASSFAQERQALFVAALQVPVGEHGWRRAWIARSAAGRIAGHVDLRSHAERFAEHRCLLGTGVDREHRRQGVGATLLAHAVQWAAQQPGLEWMDLQVLSANEPARQLYLRGGFVPVGEIPEMFRLDGRMFSFTTMTRRLR